MESSFRRSPSLVIAAAAAEGLSLQTRRASEAAAEAVPSAAYEAPSRPHSLSLPTTIADSWCCCCSWDQTDGARRACRSDDDSRFSSRERERERVRLTGIDVAAAAVASSSRSARQLLGKKVPLFSHSGVEDNTRYRQRRETIRSETELSLRGQCELWEFPVRGEVSRGGVGGSEVCVTDIGSSCQ